MPLKITNYEEHLADIHRIKVKGTDLTDIIAVCNNVEMPAHKLMIDTTKSIEEQRYQVSFEMGHYLMGSMDNRNMVTNTKARRFAMALLIDKKVIKDYLHLFSLYGKDCIILKISRTFCVNPTRVETLLKNDWKLICP